MTSEKSKGILLGVLAGGVLGSVIALLYAPKSGKEVRQDIKDKSNMLLDDATTYYNDAVHKTTELWDKSRIRASEMLSDVKTKASAMLSGAHDEVRETSNNLITAADEIRTTSKGRNKNTLTDNINANKEALKSGWDEGVNTYKEEKSSRLRK
jgi:gas vesicle protein